MGLGSTAARHWVSRLRRGLPWLELTAFTLQALKRAWDQLSPAERSELERLIRKSRGRKHNLSASERESVKRLLRRGAGLG